MSHQLCSSSQMIQPVQKEALSRSQYLIHRIELKPRNKFESKISARLLVDGEVAQSLTFSERDHALVWDCPFYCNTSPNSTISLQVYQENQLETNSSLICSIEVHASEIPIEPSVEPRSIERANDTLSVSLMLLTPSLIPGSDHVPYSETDVLPCSINQVEESRSGIGNLHRSRAAFKTILDFGEGMSGLCPATSAAAVAACHIVDQELGAQSECNKEIEEFLTSSATILGAISPVSNKSAYSTGLENTTTAILELIQKASEFILNYIPVTKAGEYPFPWLSFGVNHADPNYWQRQLKADFDRRLAEMARLERIEEVVRQLRPAGYSKHHENRGCLPGTRTTAIGDLEEWIGKNYGTDRLLWLHGPSGIGKSAIAASVCDLLDTQHMLGASFFCEYDNPELREPRLVMSTIIYSLAIHCADYGELVASAIHADPKLYTASLQGLHEGLVRIPLAKLANFKPTQEPICIVVDAIDECGTNDTRTKLLSCLLNVSQLVPWLKLIVTSCPDQDIRQFFDDTPDSLVRRLDLWEYDASSDVYAYLCERMTPKVGSSYRFEDVAITSLAERAGGLFVWADVACRFILDGFDPHRRLEEILKNPALTDASRLDSLYSAVLRSAMLGISEDDTLRQWLGVIIATGFRTPLSIKSLERLLDGRLPSNLLDILMKALNSVLYEDQSEHGQGAVRVYHQSFVDYIVTQSRSGELYVDLLNQDAMLSACCLKTMLTGLRFNICGFETSYMRNCDIPDRNSRVASVIEPHLSYSCQYWISHTVAIEPRYINMIDLRTHLFGRTLFYWIEALSMLEKLSIAASMLPKLIEWKQNPDLIDISECAQDVYEFVLSFYDVIAESVPHLYLSAIPFAPAQSAFAQRGRKWFPNTIKLTAGAMNYCSRVISHSAPILCLAVSPNGRLIATGSQDKAVQLWDQETGSQVTGPLAGHSDCVWSVVFSPNSSRIASGSHDMTIRIWGAQTSTKVPEPLIGHSGPVLCVAFSPDGRLIVSGSHDKTLRVWDAETGAPITMPFVGHSGPVLSVTFSPDGRHIASGSFDKTLRIWTETGVSAPAIGHTACILSVAFSPDSRRIASGSFDRTIQVWDSETGGRMYAPIVGHSGPVNSVSFSRDGRHIVSGSSDRTIRIWNAGTGSEISPPLLGHSGPVLAVTYLSSNRRLVSCSVDNTVRVWDRKASGGNAKVCAPLTGHTGPICSVAFSPDGRRIVSSSRDNSVLIWDAAAGTMTSTAPISHPGFVHTVAFFPGAQRIVSGGFDHKVWMWNIETGTPVSVPLQISDSSLQVALSVAFSFDGRHMVTGSIDKMVRMWDAGTGAPTSEPLAGHTDWVNAVAFSPGQQYVASGSADKTVRVWNTVTGASVSTAFAGDSGSVISVAFSPDGRRVVSGSDDSMVRVWDTMTGAPALGPLTGHSGTVWSVAFSPDGRRIISGSDDKTVRLWNVESDMPTSVPLIGHSGPVLSVAFSPDGCRFASGSYDQTIRIWDVNPTPTVSYDFANTRLFQTMQPSGWVFMDDKPFLLWIPSEFRRLAVDESSIYTSDEPISSRVTIDSSMFVHGSSWTLVASRAL